MQTSHRNQTPGKAGGCRRCLAATLVACISVGVLPNALAGGGPENVFLLVNANSDSSKTIANHYVSLRKIPPTNVFYVDWKGSVEFGTGTIFRDKLLKPAIDAIAERGVGSQIDYLVYSSDFPWRLELGDLFPDAKFEQPFWPTASLTGSTYYASLLGAQPVPVVVLPNMNWYVPQIDERNLGTCQALGDVPSGGPSRRSLDAAAAEKSSAGGAVER